MKEPPFNNLIQKKNIKKIPTARVLSGFLSF